MAEKIYNIPLYANIDGTPVIVLDPQSIPTDIQSTANSKNFINSGTANQQHLKIIDDLNEKLNTEINSLRSQLTGTLLGFPNYKQGIAKNVDVFKQNKKYVADKNGWLYVCSNQVELFNIYFINGNAIAYQDTGYANAQSIFIPIKTNDVFTISSPNTVTQITFFPCY